MLSEQEEGTFLLLGGGGLGDVDSRGYLEYAALTW